MLKHHKALQLVCLVTCIGLMFCQPIMAEDENLLDMSLDDLLNMEVSSVSKKAERLQDVASSLYVLTSEDIMNSGATSLHEVLMSKQIITRTETKITSKQGEIL